MVPFSVGREGSMVGVCTYIGNMRGRGGHGRGKLQTDSGQTGTSPGSPCDGSELICVIWKVRVGTEGLLPLKQEK